MSAISTRGRDVVLIALTMVGSGASCEQAAPAAPRPAVPGAAARGPSEDPVVQVVRTAANVDFVGVVPDGASRVRFSPDLASVAYFVAAKNGKEESLTAWIRRRTLRDGKVVWSPPLGPLVDGLWRVSGAPCWSADGSRVAISKAVTDVAVNRMALDLVVLDAGGKTRWTSRLLRPTEGAFSEGPTFGPGPDDVTLALSEDVTEIWRYREGDEPRQLFTVPGTTLENPKAAWSRDGAACCVRNNLGLWLKRGDRPAVPVVRNEQDIDARRRSWTAPQWTIDGRRCLAANRGKAYVIDLESGAAAPLPFDGQAVAAVVLPDDQHWLVIGRSVLAETPTLLDAAKRNFESVPDRYTYCAVIFGLDGKPVHDGRLFEGPDRVRRLDSRVELGMWETAPWIFALLQQFTR